LSGKTGYPHPLVGAEWLSARLEDPGVKVVDARDAEDFRRGHVKGAVSLPLQRILEDEQPERVAALLGKLGVEDETLVVTYDDRGGTHASRLAWALERAGHFKVAVLEVEFRSWADRGLPVSLKKPLEETKMHSVRENIHIVATGEEIREKAGSPHMVLVDVRSRLDYLDGHLKGAKTMPWKMFAGRGKVLAGREEMERLIDEHFISRDKEIITYSSDGASAALVFYAFRLAGFQKVKLYPGSWKDLMSAGLQVERLKEAHYRDLLGDISLE